MIRHREGKISSSVRGKGSSICLTGTGSLDVSEGERKLQMVHTFFGLRMAYSYGVLAIGKLEHIQMAEPALADY